MTTFDEYLTLGAGLKLRLYASIQGIPYVFHEDRDGFPSTLLPAGMTAKSLVLERGFDESKRTLNRSTRRIEGAQLTVRLKDDDTGTLAALFGAPRQYRKAYVTTTVGTAGDIDLSNVSSAGAAGVAYIGGESVRYTSVVGNTLTGCTRGAFASNAQTHPGDSDDGEDVFFTPPNWEGRRVYLSAYFIPDNVSPQGRATAALFLSKQLGTYRLSEPPKDLGNGEWGLTCGDLIEELADKKIGGGFIDVQLEAPVAEVNGDDTNIDLGRAANFNQFVVGGAQTYVQLKYRDYTRWFPLKAQVGPTTITVGTRSLNNAHLNDGTEIDEAKHVALMMGGGGTVALYVLASRLGDNANGDYDMLPGYDPVLPGESASRMGAGILEGELDLDSFLAFNRGDSWSFPIDEELSVSDFLFDWCLFFGAIFMTSRLGQLKVIPLEEDDGASVLEVTSKNVDVESGPLKNDFSEADIYPRLHIECGYDPIARRYTTIENNFEADIQRRSPGREASLELKSKGINVGRAASNGSASTSLGRPAITQASMTDKMRQLQQSEGRGRCYVNDVPVSLAALAADLGQRASLTLDVRDGEGSLSLTAHPARIVGMRPRYYDGVVDCDFELLDKLWRVAPACTIDSRAGAVLTLNTADIGIPDNKPGRMFANTGVEIWDQSTGTKHQCNVIAHTDTTITVDAAPAFANEHNVDFVKIDSQTNGSGATSQNGFVDSDFGYMMPDDENDGTPVEITRWR